MYAHETDLRTAEKELGAFYTAVLETYGPEAAKTAASDWIAVLEAQESLDCDAADGSSEWRSVTIAAADCMATRVTSLPALP
jgi:hypothetical protein